MNPKIRTSIIALLILALLVITILALVSAPTNPLSWLLVALLVVFFLESEPPLALWLLAEWSRIPR